ncbi:hypothetical protein HHI36_004439 [Cryptolaemus montrouzieri]|uniref:Pre-mRNA-processing factor 19 n=1 Tax=Cryptolaemus montrouzieri TaxID=559131 RepID=A0ABD2NSU1_9CUCU
MKGYYFSQSKSSPTRNAAVSFYPILYGMPIQTFIVSENTPEITSNNINTTNNPDEDLVITASPDSTIRIWNVPTSQTTFLLKAHDGAVTGLSLHPTGDYVLSTSEDQHWAFSDIRSGRLLTKVTDQTNVPLTTAQLYPDGLIFGTGTADSQVQIWDLKEQSNVANFTGHSAQSLLFHFRKTLDEGYQIKDLCFDQSGTYLAVAGSDARIIFKDHTAAATGVRFGKHARFIASTSMDRTLKLYGLE